MVLGCLMMACGDFQHNYTCYVLLLHNINKHSCIMFVFTKWLSSDSAVLFSLCWLSFFLVLSDINYFHCVRIVELLKVSESSSKNIFGGYSSKRMKVSVKEWGKRVDNKMMHRKKNSNWVTHLWLKITKPW